MKQHMRFNVSTKQGKLQITDQNTLRVQALFNKTVWEVPCANVTGFTTQPGQLGSYNLTIHTTQSLYQAELVTKQNFAKLQGWFPHLQTTTADSAWYHNPALSTHIETYTDQKKMQREVEEAGKFGWIPQTSSGIDSHVNVGRTATAAALTGGVSLLLGASRSKKEITITFIRR